MRNTRLLPWVCDDENCDTVHFVLDTPERCSCGSTDFAKGALAELTASLSCSECGNEIVPGGDCSCSCPASDYQLEEKPYRRYRTWDGESSVVSPLEYRNAMPCSHDLFSTVIGDAFDELMRSPTNVAVTTSQYLLRDLVDDSGFDDAKLLSFSDSHRNMKELDRAFTDPEVETVLDQLVLTSIGLELQRNQSGGSLSSADLQTLRPGDDSVSNLGSVTWTSLESVVDTAYELLLALEAELGGDDVRDAIGIDLGSVILGTSHVPNQERAVKDRIRRQAVRHVGERRRAGNTSLERDGLLDVRLTPTIVDELDDTEREVVKQIAAAGNNVAWEDIVGKSGPLDAAANRLSQRNVLIRPEEGRLALAPNAVEVTYVGTGDIGYDPSEDEYYTSLRRRFGQDEGAVNCPDTLAERADSSHPRFTERAYTATRSRVALLLSRLYYGSTPKMQRREIEHRFRSEPSPNFLSSGPTMELGVDIGALDALLMYGTPPNMNAYLQRVGRAGRSSHSSLVHSVSQRNPIDYYYYDEPTELITADKQPVPLNEHNERVLDISLTWAVLDYIAATFVIPWDVSLHDVTGGEEVIRRESATSTQRESASKYTQLLAKSISTLDLAEESSRLRPLGITIEDNASELRSHLESLLDYAYCPSCHRHYDADTGGEACPEGCNRTLVDAKAEHSDCIDAALRNVNDVFVEGYRNYSDRIQERIEGLKERRKDLIERQDAATEDHDVKYQQRAIEQAEARIEVLQNHLENLSGETYGDVLTKAFTEYAFNLRSVSDSVDITVVGESGEPTQIGDDRSGRDSRLALGELHPGAAYLHDRRPHVVSQVFTDDKATTDLREHVERFADDARAPLTSEFVCIECGDVTVDETTDCQCGSREWQECQLYAMESVEATLDTQLLPNKLDRAGTVYERPSERVQNTFSRRHTEILRFEQREVFSLISESGKRLGTLSYGEYDIVEYTESFRTKYQSGGLDESETLFQVCTEPNCPGIIYDDYEETRRCSVNPDHAPNVEGTNAAYARFGYKYQTEGVRLSLLESGIDVSHTLGHGLRLALQKLSGVPIRDVSEHVGEDHIDVFDSQEGGAAVARQLIQERDGQFRNFETAMEMLETQFSCDCTDGCPRCVYQYGCATRNQPNSFDLETIRDLVLDRKIELQRVNQMET